MDFQIRLRLLQEAGYLLEAVVFKTNKSYDIGLTMGTLDGVFSMNNTIRSKYPESELTYVLYTPDGQVLAKYDNLADMKKFLEEYRYNSYEY